MKSFARAKLILLLFLLPLLGCTDRTYKSVRESKQPEFLLSNQRSPAADFSEKDIFEKRTVSLRNLRGKVVMLNFWATWCPPCRQETPTLVALQKLHMGQLLIVGVSVFSYTTATEQFYKDYEIDYPVVYGSYELMEQYGKVSAIPTTFLIDKQGRIAARVVGSRTKEQYEDMIKPLLLE
jgi:thiol-disulfide isomerase/thioredoxin